MRTCLTLAHPMVPTPLISGMLLLSHSIANYLVLPYCCYAIQMPTVIRCQYHTPGSTFMTLPLFLECSIWLMNASDQAGDHLCTGLLKL